MLRAKTSELQPPIITPIMVNLGAVIEKQQLLELVVSVHILQMLEQPEKFLEQTQHPFLRRHVISCRH